MHLKTKKIDRSHDSKTLTGPVLGAPFAHSTRIEDPQIERPFS